MKKIFSSVGLLLMLLIVNISPVSAARPTIEEGTMESPTVVINCGDYSINIDSWSRIKTTYYWNPDGSLNRYHIHGEGFETYTNTTTGKSLNGSEEGFNLFGDASTTKLAGLLYHLVVPGKGTILIDAGYIYIDASGFVLNGNHPVGTYFWLNGDEDFSKLCAVLR